MVRTYRLSCSLPSSACHPHQISVSKARVGQQQWKLPRGPCFVRPTTSRPIPSIILRATDQKQEQGQVKEEEIVDNKILPYCSINKKEEKRTVGELEQDFLEALQSFYFENKPIMTNEEFDNLKEELMWEGSSVVMLSKDEQKFMEASLAYNAGKPIMNDAQYDELKLNLKKSGSKVAIEGPRCSLRSRNVYSDLTVDYFKMFLLNVPAAIVALSLVFFLDDLTGFEITYLLELPEPYSFIVSWFLVLPATYLIAQTITNVILKDFLILKGPCPNCGRENVSFYGTILTVPSGGPENQVKCETCGTMMLYNSETRLITLAPNKQEGSKWLVTRNDQYVPPAYADKNLIVLHNVRAPSITVPKYLVCIFKYMNCSPSYFVVGYIYIDRLVHRQPNFPITSLNLQRLLLTSVMIAAKMLNNAFYKTLMWDFERRLTI